MRAGWRRLTGNKRGAVAPTVAMALFGLIGMGGIAFDYAHLANLDTELQQAADQAALAAATQLDGSNGSRARATAAAQQLLNNATMFASDASGVTGDPGKVTIANVEFFQSYNEATDAYGPAASNDADAKVVQVTVGGRRADYALTPVIGVLSSGTIDAQALASLASSVCMVPPLMMCVPAGADFPAATDIGKGVLLQPGPNVGAWAPGDNGYLDFADGASGLATNLGRNSDHAGCVDMSDGIPTEPGNKASVTDALNSRFDLYPAGQSTCNPANGDFCPAENTGKDLTKTKEVVISLPKGTTPAPMNPGCDDVGATVIGKSNSTDTNGFVQGNTAKGLTRDICHISSTCSPNAKFGDGEWARAAYFAANHVGELGAAATWAGKDSTAVKGPTALMRYDVYKWELADKAVRLATKQTDLTDYANYKKTTGQTDKYTFTNQCTYPHPVNGTGIASSATQKDRRVLTVAAVDCTGLNGKSDVIVKQWVDVFLVEPSLTRTVPYATGKEQIYVEIAGVAKLPNGNSAFQNYLRQRPRLLR
jgi:Flp pilus assembly protein TadG